MGRKAFEKLKSIAEFSVKLGLRKKDTLSEVVSQTFLLLVLLLQHSLDFRFNYSSERKSSNGNH